MDLGRPYCILKLQHREIKSNRKVILKKRFSEDHIGALIEAGWNTLTSDRKSWRVGKGFYFAGD